MEFQCVQTNCINFFFYIINEKKTLKPALYLSFILFIVEKRKSLNIYPQNTVSIQWLFPAYTVRCCERSQKKELVLGRAGELNTYLRDIE